MFVDWKSIDQARRRLLKKEATCEVAQHKLSIFIMQKYNF